MGSAHVHCSVTATLFVRRSGLGILHPTGVEIHVVSDGKKGVRCMIMHALNDRPRHLFRHRPRARPATGTPRTVGHGGERTSTHERRGPLGGQLHAPDRCNGLTLTDIETDLNESFETVLGLSFDRTMASFTRLPSSSTSNSSLRWRECPRSEQSQREIQIACLTPVRTRDGRLLRGIWP